MNDVLTEELVFQTEKKNKKPNWLRVKLPIGES